MITPLKLFGPPDNLGVFELQKNDGENRRFIRQSCTYPNRPETEWRKACRSRTPES